MKRKISFESQNPFPEIMNHGNAIITAINLVHDDKMYGFFVALSHRNKGMSMLFGFTFTFQQITGDHFMETFGHYL